MAKSGTCTACGAALPEADALGLITCPGCGLVTKLAGPTNPEPPPLQGWPAAPVAAPHPGGQWDPPAAVAGASTVPPVVRPPVRPARSGRRLGCTFVSVAVVTVIGFSLVGAIRSCEVNEVKSAFNPNNDLSSSMITLSGGATVLPASGESGTDVITVAQDTEGSVTTRTIARVAFTSDGSRLRWQSEPLAQDAYRVEVAQVDDTLFAATEDQLYALDPDSGETRWKTTLRDKLTGGCPDCFCAVDGHLIVRTTDAYVTAYGTRSAEAQWTKRLNSTAGSISVAGGRLFVVDDPEDATAITPVALVDPANGRTIRSTTPTCPAGGNLPWDLEMSAGDGVRAIPGTDDVVAAFGFGDGCVVRWTPSSGAIRWTSRLTGMSSIDEDAILIGERDLVLGGRGAPLVTVYLPNGKARLLGAPGDLQATPAQIVGRTLVALTVTTRGTPRGGLAGWDLASGERTWANASLGAAQPVSTGPYHSSDALFDGSPRSLVVPFDGGLNVFVFEGTNRTFSVAPLDLATGELGAEVRRAFLTRYDSGTPSLTVEGSTDDRLIVSLDNLLQALPLTGRGDVVSFPAKN